MNGKGRKRFTTYQGETIVLFQGHLEGVGAEKTSRVHDHHEYLTHGRHDKGENQ